ncbi:MAG: helix-turn-helix domain-containing protein, partial [Clostridia bacterium]|nr:helix-turn-helix domain-containing protein [Clostridia bacterium]
MFNERLKFLRKLKNYTQKELAAMIGCDQSMIVRCEKGECEPTATAIKKIAMAFNVSADY